MSNTIESFACIGQFRIVTADQAPSSQGTTVRLIDRTASRIRSSSRPGRKEPFGHSHPITS